MKVPVASRRLAFAGYAGFIFILTHVPGVNLGTKVRVDLVVHFAVFGLWALLLSAAEFFGPMSSWRNVLFVWPIAVAYAAVDEGLQALPFVHRHAAVDDWLANVGGITLACAGLLLLGRLRTNPTTP